MMTDIPWQLKMFQKTLKKRMRLKSLKRHIGDFAPGDRCLLVTCGDNNGAMNYYLRQIGGQWSWADHEDQSIADMSRLLGDPVLHIPDGRLPFEDNYFQCVVSIDVHEHLEDPDPFTQELRRVAVPGGKIIITVPNGDESKVAVRIKHMVGMTKEKYGHYRVGFDMPQLKALMQGNGIAVHSQSSFSFLFTELLELGINLLYVNVLSKKSKAKVKTGTIAPATADQLKSVNKSYRMYALVYPVFTLISKLDWLCRWGTGYVVMAEGRKS